jgi:hypothetical protein
VRHRVGEEEGEGEWVAPPVALSTFEGDKEIGCVIDCESEGEMEAEEEPTRDAVGAEGVGSTDTVCESVEEIESRDTVGAAEGVTMRVLVTAGEILCVTLGLWEDAKLWEARSELDGVGVAWREKLGGMVKVRVLVF